MNIRSVFYFNPVLDYVKLFVDCDNIVDNIQVKV